MKVNESKKIISGIKLLKKSKYYVLPFENNAINTQPRRKIFRKRFKNKDIQQRALEVAVSGEWVLSQKETEHWATNNKGKVEIIKY